MASVWISVNESLPDTRDAVLARMTDESGLGNCTYYAVLAWTPTDKKWIELCSHGPTDAETGGEIVMHWRRIDG